MPSWKGVAMMRRRTVLALAGASAIAVAAGGGAIALAAPAKLAAPAAPAGLASTSSPSATIRIEGSKKTLVPPRTVRTGSGSITKYGAPKGKCPAQSLQGALNRATHGNWKGTWYGQYNEYLITSILGEKPSGHNFWEIFINNNAATKGACDLKFQKGEKIVFADTDGKHTPASLKAPRGAAPNSSFTVRLLGYSSSGKSTPLAGVKITGRGIQAVRTDASGVAQVVTRGAGRLVLRAAPRGYIRTEAVVQVVASHRGASNTY
jgi:hypothetical protein